MPKSSGLYSRETKLVQYLKRVNVIYFCYLQCYLQQVNKENHMVISINREKSFKNSISIYDKTPQFKKEHLQKIQYLT